MVSSKTGRKEKAARKGTRKQCRSKNEEGPGKHVLMGTERMYFTHETYAKCQTMFVRFEGEAAPNPEEVHSTNILALCLKHFYAALAHESVMNPIAERFAVLRLSRDHWTLYQFVDGNGKQWYQACFVDASLPLECRSNQEGAPRWIKQLRPWTMDDAAQCVPPQFRKFAAKKVLINEEGKKSKALLFGSIELALRMEAAFCLEYHFGLNNKHWYQFKTQDLVEQLLARVPSASKILSAGEGGTAP